MNPVTTAKTVYEIIPKSIKFALSPLFVRMMVRNKVFVKTWKELDEFEHLSEAGKRQYQFNKLKELMVYANQNVSYYREIFEKNGFIPEEMKDAQEIGKLPLLEKADAIALAKKLYSSEKGLAYYKSYTGGSSGQALTVMLDKDSIYKERAVVTHFLSKFGYDPLRTKTVAFWGHNRDENYYYSPLKNEIVISPFRLFKDDQLNGICDDIENFGATFLMGYPSAIYLFAQLLEKSSRKLNIEHVVYYAENCSPEEKQYIEKVLCCPVDSYYGHTERACFAEISDSGCVFNDYYGYTELIPTENKKEYRIVCTGFLSRKMPLIRYATDDVVCEKDDGSLYLLGHKRSEIHLVSKNGQKIFKGAMTLHIEELKKARKYQFVQNEPGQAELQIVLDEPLSSVELQHINHYIQRRCENLLDVSIRIVKEVQLTSRGKYNWAVNNIEK